MDDFLLEAAAEVEAAHAEKKKNAPRGDILMSAASAVEREYEDDGFEEEEEINRKDVSREDVKNMLRKAARSVDNDDAADARDILQDVAKSFEPADTENKPKIRDSRSDEDDESIDIGAKLNKAAEEVLDGRREYEEETKPTEPESDPESPVVSDEDEDEEREYKDNNLFMISCYKRDIDAVERHLEKGANSMYRDRHGWTTLHWAAAKGFDDIAEVLISRFSGANLKRYVNCKDRITGWTPLHVRRYAQTYFDLCCDSLNLLFVICSWLA
jgi:ankyrin repeat protein